MEVSGMGRKMDAVVLAWPSVFVNNAVPVTLSIMQPRFSWGGKPQFRAL